MVPSSKHCCFNSGDSFPPRMILQIFGLELTATPSLTPSLVIVICCACVQNFLNNPGSIEYDMFFESEF